MANFYYSYNERLFSGGLRKWLHEMRFRWLREQTKGMNGAVFELGCFDARSLEYMSFSPARYLGVDAGWEGGLEEAKKRYPDFEFLRSESAYNPKELFDVAVTLETLEHLPRQELRNYIDVLARTAPVLLATVPVEIGPVFLCKHFFKSLLGSNESYRFKELLCSALCMTKQVEQCQHKGFNYRVLIAILRTRYRKVTITGLPFSVIPFLSFTVGIRAER
jgi:hypothetical protein